MNYVKVFNENLSDEYSEIIAELNELLEFYISERKTHKSLACVM